MTKAIWQGAVLAESDDCVVVEGNLYFPPASIDSRCFKPSDTTTVCSWKGVAHYYHIEVGGNVNRDAARYYPELKDAAGHIKGPGGVLKGGRGEAVVKSFRKVLTMNVPGRKGLVNI